MEPKLLFHFNHPKGKLLDSLRKFNSDEDLVAAGWTEYPENVKEPGLKIEPISKAKLEEASPDALVGMVKALGFNVLTDDQLQAELVKANQGKQLDITSVTDASLHAEFERRSGNNDAAILSSLQERFNADPVKMNKEDLVVYGKVAFGLKLTMTMKEETLIGKINEAKLAAQ